MRCLASEAEKDAHHRSFARPFPSNPRIVLARFGLSCQFSCFYVIRATGTKPAVTLLELLGPNLPDDRRPVAGQVGSCRSECTCYADVCRGTNDHVDGL